MSHLPEHEIDAIVREYQRQKITFDMLNAENGVGLMLEPDQAAVGAARMPWPALAEAFELRPGELTLIAGANGSGKSMLAGQMVAWAMCEGQNCMVASMEMLPKQTLRRMVAQCSGGPYSREFAVWWGQTYREQLWLWDVQDSIPTQTVLDRVEAVASHLGTNIVVIDSLLKCGIAQDGDGYLTAQSRFVESLQHIAKHVGIHIALVVHLRKPDRGQRSGKYDIRGASQISDLADNVLLMHRNQDKHEARQAQEQGDMLTAAQSAALDKADAILEVAKQRHGDWEGTIRLNLHGPSLQFRPHNWTGPYEWPHRNRGPR